MTHVDAYLLDGSTFVSGAKLQSLNVIISLLAMLLILSHFSRIMKLILHFLLSILVALL